MCGIFGSLGTLSNEALDRAAHAIHHRGPDASGRYVDSQVTLLHARLKIIDLSEAAAQPMRNDDGSVQVVFNGEIYNHSDLRRELEGRFHFRSRSDTEAIVRGYEAWGDRVTERIDGMFAFALWDRGRRRLLVARDRAGKKPLYYTEPDRDGVVRFGSTIGALIASGHPAALDEHSLPFYLAYGFVPEPRTIYRGVHQLPPGHRAVWVEGERAPRVEAYWEPSFGARPCADDYATAKARVRTLVEQAVERRLQADVPLGAFLSGGIDSTVIVGATARRIGKVKTFSIGFAGDPRYDETRYARMAARAFSTEHTEFMLEPSSFQLVETLVQHHDGPFGDSSAIPTYVVSQLTRAHVTVALTGDGGDELFCGYQRFLAAEAAERVPLALRRAASGLVRFLPARSERSLAGKARRFLSAAAQPLADRMTRWHSFFPDPREILNEGLIRELGAAVDAPADWQRSVFRQSDHGGPILAQILEHNFRTYLPCDLLVKADRCSMAHALELRAPFLDTALIEYVRELPPGYLRRGTLTKRILKEAFADLLPIEIQRRGKMGFGVPLGTWFRGDLRGYLHDHLGRGARLDRYLARPAVDRLLDDHARGLVDHGHRLWSLLTLELWLKHLP